VRQFGARRRHALDHGYYCRALPPCLPAGSQIPPGPIATASFGPPGHKAPALYAGLAFAGFFPIDELVTLRKLHARLQGHPHWLKLPGVEVSSGSLGRA